MFPLSFLTLVSCITALFFPQSILLEFHRFYILCQGNSLEIHAFSLLYFFCFLFHCFLLFPVISLCLPTFVLSLFLNTDIIDLTSFYFSDVDIISINFLHVLLWAHPTHVDRMCFYSVQKTFELAFADLFLPLNTPEVFRSVLFSALILRDFPVIFVLLSIIITVPFKF